MREKPIGIHYALLAIMAVAAMLACLYLWPRRNEGAFSSIRVEQSLQMPAIAKSRLRRIGDVPSSVKDSDEDVQLQFVNESCGWLSVEKELWQTRDGGKNWQLVYDDPSDAIRQFEFIDAHVGWMITRTTLHKTDDGGSTWTVPLQPLHSASEGHLSSLKFLGDHRRGWVSGGIYKSMSRDEYVPTRYMSADERQSLRGVIFYTEDGGENWRRQLVTPHWGHFTVLFATDAEHAWVAGTAGAFYLSSQTWRQVEEPRPEPDTKTGVQSLAVRIGYPTIEPACIFFLSPTLGWLSNSNGCLAATRDGGRKWQDIYYPNEVNADSPDDFVRLFFVDEMNGWARGYEGGLYSTTDGGRSWERQSPEIHFYDFCSDHSGIRWAVAKEGLFRFN